MSGEVAEDGLERLTELLDENYYDFLILLEVGNDILQDLSQTQLKNNLAHMIELAQECQVPLMNFLIGQLMKQPKYKLDTVHFNEAGYQKMASEIHKEMKKLGAL